MNQLKNYVVPFFQHLKLERNLSENTIVSYRNDIERLFRYYPKKTEITSDDLIHFIQFLADLGLCANSLSRNISTFKTFFTFLKKESIIEESPADFLHKPKTIKSLPEVFTIPEIEKILNLIRLDDWKGIRDRALLETMYGAGLRVSEAITLKNDQLFLNRD